MLYSRTVLAPLVVHDIVFQAFGADLIDTEKIGRVEAAVREALSNAVIHGNLGLPGLGAFGNLEAQEAAVVRGLADPDRGTRAVTVTWSRVGPLAVLHIQDDGEGFHWEPAGCVTPSALSGRGLILMRVFARKMRFSRGGRRVSLAFPIPDRRESAPSL